MVCNSITSLPVYQKRGEISIEIRESDEKRSYVFASGGAFRMRRRRSAVCSAVTAAPRAHSFLSYQKRMGRNAAMGTRIALSRLKRHFVSVCHSPMARPVRNALRAVVQSGFLNARYTVRVVLFAPVEYLTYGSRKAVFFARAALRIAHKRTAAQLIPEIAAEYFDYHASLGKTHLHRVLLIQK